MCSNIYVRAIRLLDKYVLFIKILRSLKLFILFCFPLWILFTVTQLTYSYKHCYFLLLFQCYVKFVSPFSKSQMYFCYIIRYKQMDIQIERNKYRLYIPNTNKGIHPCDRMVKLFAYIFCIITFKITNTKEGTHTFKKM